MGGRVEDAAGGLTTASAPLDPATSFPPYPTAHRTNTSSPALGRPPLPSPPAQVGEGKEAEGVEGREAEGVDSGEAENVTPTPLTPRNAARVSSGFRVQG